MMSALQKLNLTLRVLLEVGVVAAFAYWGIYVGQSTLGEVLLGIGVPLVGFGLWGALDFRRSQHGEVLRLMQELFISGLAAVAWYAAGAHPLAIALGVLTIVYHALVYESGERLLKPRAHQPRLAGSRSRDEVYRSTSGRHVYGRPDRAQADCSS